MKNEVLKRFFVLAAALVSAVAAYTWHWYQTTDNIRDGLPDLIRAAHDQGYNLDLGEPVITGYPYRIIVDFPTIKLSPRDPIQKWSVRSENVVGFVQPWNLSHLIFEFTHGATVSWHGIDYLWTADTAMLSLRLSNLEPRRLSADMAGLRVAASESGPAYRARRTQLHLERQDGDTAEAADLRLSLKAEDVTLPENVQNALTHLGGSVPLLHATGTAARVATADATAWALSLSDISVDWPPVEFQGSGALSLDELHRPQGSIRAETRGYQSIVDSLESAGALSARKAVTTRTALEMLRASAGGSNGRLPVVLDITDGRLYLGPIKLLRVPALW
jgi:hypothetical protein